MYLLVLLLDSVLKGKLYSPPHSIETNLIHFS
jgi:hypothetical protein